MGFLETTAKIILTRSEAVYEERTGENGFEGFGSLKRLAESLSSDEVSDWIDHLERDDIPIENIEAKRYRQILDIVKADDIMHSLIDLSIASYMIPQFEAWLELRFEMKNCLELACRIEAREFEPEKNILNYAIRASKLFGIDISKQALRYAKVEMSGQLMAYLSGSDETAVILKDSTEIFDPSGEQLHALFVNEEIKTRAVEGFKRGAGLVQLAGNGGRRFLVKHIARDMGKRFIFVDMLAMVRDNAENRSLYINALKREAILRDYCICFWNLPENIFPGKDDMGRQFENILFKPLMAENILLIVCSDKKEKVIRGGAENKSIYIEMNESNSYSDRLRYWQGLSNVYGTELDVKRYAMRYALSVSEVADVFKKYTNPEQDDRQDIAELCRNIAVKRGASDVGRIIIPRFRLSDVKLKPALKEDIEEVLRGASEIRRIMEEWKLAEKYPYGQGLCVLMTGAPGTGKTMTAHAIASELVMPLFQINLSEVLDKYIGETEKKLEKAFEFAEKTNSILFFDEADSVFGKRSEVTEAKDRYANNEVSYLLQRIEAYEGIVLLATNFAGNIDPAFLRRIRYILRFENPDTEVRKAIWESCFTEDVPHDEIDFDYLAEQFTDFNGSTIKNVFLNACVSAAGKGERLDMRHIIKAVVRELQKTASIAFQPEILGRYSYLVL